MRKENGITLVSLVVTIIVLIILAGISINLTIGQDGIITKAKQAKENIEIAKVEEETRLNELYEQLETEGGYSSGISYDAIAKLTEFKKAIADYIGEAGGIKPEYTAESTTFGDSIKGILKEVTKDATATAEDIAEGKTAYVNGNLIAGTLGSLASSTNVLLDEGEIKSSDIKSITTYNNVGYTLETIKNSKKGLQVNTIGNSICFKIDMTNYSAFIVGAVCATDNNDQFDVTISSSPSNNVTYYYGSYIDASNYTGEQYLNIKYYNGKACVMNIYGIK